MPLVRAQEPTTLPDSHARFPKTHGTLIVRARANTSTEARAAVQMTIENLQRAQSRLGREFGTCLREAIGRTVNALPAVLLIAVLTACKPTVHDFMQEDMRALQPYVTGDVHAAKSALLAEEQIISKYEAARTAGFDVHGSYVINYARQCSLHLYLGETNQAQDYLRRVITHRSLNPYVPTGEVTMEVLFASISNLDATLEPKWRQAKFTNINATIIRK